LTIYEPNEIEQVTETDEDNLYFSIVDEVPTGTINGINLTYTL